MDESKKHDRDLDDPSYPEGLRELEVKAILERRKSAKPADKKNQSKNGGKQTQDKKSSANAPGTNPFLRDLNAQAVEPVDNQLPDAIGLAISGGGIRSATFALGVLQSMAESRFLRLIDFMSTVSGGSYIGSFLGRHYIRGKEFAEKEQKQSRDENAIISDFSKSGVTAKYVEDTIADSRSYPVYWLRENGRYLTPRGGGDVLVAAAAALRDWVSLQLFIGVFVLALLFVGHTVQAMYASKSLDVCTAEARIRPILFSKDKTIYDSCRPPSQSDACNSTYTGSESPTKPICAEPQSHEARETNEAGSEICSWKSVDHYSWNTFVDWWNCATEFTGVPLFVVAAAMAVFCALYWALVYAYFLVYRERENEHNSAKKARMRRDVTEVTSYLLLVSLLLAAYRFIDLAGFHLYYSESKFFAELGAGLSAALGIASRFWANVFTKSNKDSGSIKKLFAPMMTVAGVLLLVGYLTCLSALSYWCDSKGTGVYPAPVVLSAATALKFGAVLALISILWGRLDGFLNLTTLHAFYTARLVRAYLGASNTARWSAKGKGITEPVNGDDIQLAKYRPNDFGGPLHIINSTLNETVSGESQIEQRDRKGLPLAVSALAMSVGVSHHAKLGCPTVAVKQSIESLRDYPPGSFPLIPKGEINAEALSVGDWVGISGAAVSSGMGALSTLGYSMMLAFFNIRMGYWWDSGINPSVRFEKTPRSLSGKLSHAVDTVFTSVFQVQSYLLDEFFGRFHGPGRQSWNLTDGGHFENSGVYELIRRELPLIICLDNGEDPDYKFEDLANLVRRARTDFGAEIRFIETEVSEQTTNFTAQQRGRKKVWEIDQTIVDPGGAVTIRKESIEWLKSDPPAGIKVLDGLEQMITGTKGFFGRIDSLKRISQKSNSQSHAAIGLVRYKTPKNKPASEDKLGILIWVKPTLTGDETTDISEYHSLNESFPHETTADFFFDEAQWESYRKLGTHIGDQLMAALEQRVGSLLGK